MAGANMTGGDNSTGSVVGPVSGANGTSTGTSSPVPLSGLPPGQGLDASYMSLFFISLWLFAGVWTEVVELPFVRKLKGSFGLEGALQIGWRLALAFFVGIMLIWAPTELHSCLASTPVLAKVDQATVT